MGVKQLFRSVTRHDMNQSNSMNVNSLSGFSVPKLIFFKYLDKNTMNYKHVARQQTNKTTPCPR